MNAKVHYRSVWSNALLAGSCVLFGLVGVAMLLSSGPDGVDASGRVLGLVLSVLFGSLAWRAFRAGIAVNDDGVIVHSMFRTRSLPWDSISAFRVGGSWSLVPWQTLTIERTDGTTVTAAEFSTLPVRHPTIVERAVEALNQQLQRRRPSSTTPQ
jgi:hypothetical protein